MCVEFKYPLRIVSRTRRNFRSLCFAVMLLAGLYTWITVQNFTVTMSSYVKTYMRLQNGTYRSRNESRSIRIPVITVTSEPILNLTEMRQNIRKKLGNKATAEELKYYKLNESRIKHYDFEFVVNGDEICKDVSSYLTVLIPSAPQKLRAREMIRETWGKYAKGLQIPPPFNTTIVSLVFILGRTNVTNDRDCLFESEKYQDIIIGNFHDSYRNLTRKILMGLKWIASNCGSVENVLKVDDDIYVNIPQLVEVLKKHTPISNDGVFGHLYGGGRAERAGKWAVSKDEYPLSRYPPYMSGTSYVISGNIVRKLLTASQYMPYLPIEDVFITGILPRIIGVQQQAMNGFTWWGEKRPDPCEFMTAKKITANDMNPTFMREMWNTQLNYPQSCTMDSV